MPAIELDNNATTRPCQEAVAAATLALTACWHNPSSVHRAGQDARAHVERARQSLAHLIHAKPRDLILTSGGTEAIHLALRGSLATAAPGRRTLLTTAVEHASGRDAAQRLASQGVRVINLPLLPGGLVDLAALDTHLDASVALVSVQWANNETGAIQPVHEIARRCHALGVPFHVDAVQWVGKMPADAPALGASLLSFSPHKFHGPKGVGALWVRPGTRLEPLFPGTQELDRRGGTENVPGILGAGAAALEATRWLADPAPRALLARARDDFESTIRAALPDTVINAPPATDGSPTRLWNTSNLGFPGLEAEALLLLLSERGVHASAGAACSSGSLEPSPVLLAMNIPHRVAHGSLRFSLSRDTTPDELARAAALIIDAVRTLRRSSDTLAR